MDVNLKDDNKGPKYEEQAATSAGLIPPFERKAVLQPREGLCSISEYSRLPERRQ